MGQTAVRRGIGFAIVLLVLGCALGASAASFPTGFSQEVVASGLTNPTAIAFFPDGRIAIAEKTGGGRLVVIAAPFPLDEWTDPLRRPDPTLLKQRILASRFPGNMELFCNSVFWLAKMEPMIAISPAAMEVARIEPMGEGALRFWRVGGLLIGLPALVVVAGAMVYFARRD